MEWKRSIAGRRGARELAFWAAIVSAVPGVVACTVSTKSDCTRALHGAPLEPGVGFGGLRIGMSPAEVEEWIGPAERTVGADAWEYPSCGFALVFGPERVLGALLAGGHPTLNERFTAESERGLGIGSSRQEIVGVLGEPSRTSSAGAMLHYDAQGIDWTLTDDRATHLTIRRSRPATEG